MYKAGIVSSTIVIFILTGYAFAGVVQRSAEELYDRGESYLASGDYGGAIEQFEEVIKISSNFKDVRTKCAKAYFSRFMDSTKKTGNFAGGNEDIDKAIEMDPKNGMYYYVRGQRYRYNAGNLDEAFKDYSTAIGLGGPTEYSTYFERLLIHIIREDYNGALDDIDKMAIFWKNQREPIELILAKGYVYILIGRVNAARVYWLSAIEASGIRDEGILYVVLPMLDRSSAEYDKLRLSIKNIINNKNDMLGNWLLGISGVTEADASEYIDAISNKSPEYKEVIRLYGYFVMAEVAMANGDRIHANQLFNKAVSSISKRNGLDYTYSLIYEVAKQMTMPH